MACEKEIVDYIVQQMQCACTIVAKKMFGEYGLYCNGKIIGFICDDQLFIKANDEAQAFIGDVTFAPPYLGAKPYILISGAHWDDGDWLSELALISFAALPEAKPKSRPKKK